MITVTRRNGLTFALNPDLIERVEATPDTVITLVSGARYVVAESIDCVVDQVYRFRAAVLIASADPQPETTSPARLRSVSSPEN